ncbi:unnamed protein product, partial [Diplocarpon coronariae]
MESVDLHAPAAHPLLTGAEGAGGSGSMLDGTNENGFVPLVTVVGFHHA